MRRQLSSGELILFTGAGFSRGAVAVDGHGVPSAWELKEDLWRLAFPSRPFDTESSLGDIFDVAVARNRNQTRDLLNRRLKVNPTRIPERYKSWFSLPWYRHYTLNIDDLDEAVAGANVLPRIVRPLSAARDDIPVVAGLLSVHMNGRLRDFPNVTFSAPQYGQRTARPDVWYATLVADLLDHPVVFIGTALDEPSLWQQIELRRGRGEKTIEMRPPSYLVCPSLPIARRALLKRFNIDFIEATEQGFFDEVLADVAAEASMGHEQISARLTLGQGLVAMRTLRDARQELPDPDPSLYLLGREPRWSDITEGFAITRGFEEALLKETADSKPNLVLVTGTAASGKSTTAMRLALGMDGLGKTVMVLDALKGNQGIGNIVAAAGPLAPDVILIDDIDIFGNSFGRLVSQLSRLASHPTVVAAIRSSRLQALDQQAEFVDLKVIERTVPSLEDGDISDLLDALRDANRLGLLLGKTRREQTAVFRDQSGRQLLVAMYRATSGEKLQDKIFSECEDLDGAGRLAYGMAAVATSERYGVRREELALGMGAVLGKVDNEALNEVQKLIDRGLLIQDGNDLRVRHRWIAETALEFYAVNGLLKSTLQALLFAVSTKANPQAGVHSREIKLLRRLLNHEFMQRQLADPAAVRTVYDYVEDRLAWDYHYWLQRGSFEVESGNLSMAENFLNSAKSLCPRSDFRVTTEYAYLLLKKAAHKPRAADSPRLAETAFRDLEATIASRGREDSYPFHVYGSQGLSWARRAPLSPQDRQALLRRLLDIVDQGRVLHPRRVDLRHLGEDLQKEYLMTVAKNHG